MADFSGLIEYCRLREEARLRRERGDPPPWSEDPVLSAYRFCNVSPWLDKTTVRMLRAVELAGDDPCWKAALLLGLRCSSYFPLADLCADDPPLSADALERRVLRCVALHGRATTPSFSRIGPAIRLVVEPAGACAKLTVEDWRGATVKTAFDRLVALPWVGPFIAYLAARDLTALFVQDDGWVRPGPGACKGLEKCGVTQDADGVRAACEALEGQVPSWRFDVHDAQHSLCEFHKWRRASDGGRKPRERLVR